MRSKFCHLIQDFSQSFVPQPSQVYAQDTMRTRLLASALVLLLSVADSGATAICAAYCLSPASSGRAVVHHHQMESNSQLSPTNVSQHAHSHHRGAPCAQCARTSHYGLNQKADCANLVQIQALKESSFSLDVPNKVAHIDVVGAPNADLSVACDREQCLVFDTSQIVRSSDPASLPLRI